MQSKLESDDEGKPAEERDTMPIVRDWEPVMHCLT